METSVAAHPSWPNPDDHTHGLMPVGRRYGDWIGLTAPVADTFAYSWKPAIGRVESADRIVHHEFVPPPTLMSLGEAMRIAEREASERNSRATARAFHDREPPYGDEARSDTASQTDEEFPTPTARSTGEAAPMDFAAVPRRRSSEESSASRAEI